MALVPISDIYYPLFEELNIPTIDNLKLCCKIRSINKHYYYLVETRSVFWSNPLLSLARHHIINNSNEDIVADDILPELFNKNHSEDTIAFVVEWFIYKRFTKLIVALREYSRDLYLPRGNVSRQLRIARALSRVKYNTI